MALAESLKLITEHQRAARPGAELTPADIVTEARNAGYYQQIQRTVTDPGLLKAYLDVVVATSAATEAALERLDAAETGRPTPKPTLSLRTAIELVTADAQEQNELPDLSAAEAVTDVRIELTSDDVAGTVEDRQLLDAYELVMGADRGEIDRELRRLPQWVVTREERERSRELEQAHRQRVMENDVLARAERVSPDDDSVQARHLRETAGSIREHRESAARQRHAPQATATPAERADVASRGMGVPGPGEEFPTWRGEDLDDLPGSEPVSDVDLNRVRAAMADLPDGPITDEDLASVGVTADEVNALIDVDAAREAEQWRGDQQASLSSQPSPRRVSTLSTAHGTTVNTRAVSTSAQGTDAVDGGTSRHRDTGNAPQPPTDTASERTAAVERAATVRADPLDLTQFQQWWADTDAALAAADTAIGHAAAGMSTEGDPQFRQHATHADTSLDPSCGYCPTEPDIAADEVELDRGVER